MAANTAAVSTHETKLQKFEHILEDIGKYATAATVDTITAEVKTIHAVVDTHETAIQKTAAIIGDVAPVAAKFGLPEAAPVASLLELVLNEIASIKGSLSSASK